MSVCDPAAVVVGRGGEGGAEGKAEAEAEAKVEVEVAMRRY